MKHTKWIVAPLLLLVVALSCERPVNPISEGSLTFDQDTVAFDSVFTTLQTPTERLIVYNEEGRDLNIDRVWLEKGENSQFSLIVDGIQADDVSDVVLANQDSLHIFVTLTSDLTDEFAEDYILFQIGTETQRVLVQAFIIDAFFLRSRLRQEGDFLNLDSGSFFFRVDTTLTPEKPIIFDGPIYVPEGITVTILPGTEIFFTPYQFGVKDSNGLPTFGLYSWLIVAGTLKAEGMPGNPVVFQGTRLDSLYQENPAQWRGLRFTQSSRDNLLRHCVIKNAQIGVQVDSISINGNPKVTIQYTHIRNMGVHGVVGLGFDPSGTTAFSRPAILMENSIVNTCKQRTLLILGGGKYAFYNCTFANFNLPRFSRRVPQALIGNWFTFDNMTANVYPSYTDFTNCIFWGGEEDEVVFDTLEGAPFDELRFNNCIVKVSDDYEPSLDPHLFNSLKNQDPLFRDFFTRNYRIEEGSPAIDAGIDFPAGSTGYNDDVRNLPDSARINGFDIGAFEFIPE